MTLFLTLFTVFNACVGTAALGRAVRFLSVQARARWASKRLLGIAIFVAWTLPALCVAGTTIAWRWLGGEYHAWSAPVILAPVAWLVIWGILFAIVDFAEDGEFDFGRGPSKKRQRL